MPKYIESRSTSQTNKGQNPNVNHPTRSKKFDLARETPVRVKFKNQAFSEPDKIYSSQPTKDIDPENEQTGRKFPVRVKFKNPAFSEPNGLYKSQPTGELDPRTEQAGRKFETEGINLKGSNFPKSSKQHQ